jgi:hypothetical protein
LEQEKIKLKREQLRATSSLSPKSGGSSGRSTPHSQSTKGERDYFPAVRLHFKAHNNTDRYEITRTKLACNIFDGKNISYTTGTDVVSMRNLYLMLNSCNYNVTAFLEKCQQGEFDQFDHFDGSEQKTPDPFNERSNVYAYAMDK